jgi:CRISPR system Cascade subunit CasC
MKTIIEIHALQNFGPSNLNRDDTGAPKDAFFGGYRRARVSSQCLKRAIRQYFHVKVGQGTLNVDDIASRTKRVLDAIVELLVSEGHSELESKSKTQLALAAIELSIKDGKSEYLLFLGQREIQEIARIISEKWDTINTAAPQSESEKKPGKAKKDAAKQADPELRKALDKVFNGGKALDVALFGRMLADMPAKNQDAACQVAHAISTHSVEREFDFYTAVDDLKPEDTAGADMMGTIEFNSACFYRYAVVDWEKLISNLQGDVELAKKGLVAFLEGFVVAEPTGKQNTFAAHNPPEFVAMSIRHDTAPRNLANAFEMPIRANKNEALTLSSAAKLVEKGKALSTAFGGAGKTYVLDLTGVNLAGFGEAVGSLDELLGKVSSEIKE